MSTTTPEPLWSPDPESLANCELTRFMRRVEQRTGRGFTTYDDLRAWSVDDVPGFWAALWEHFGLDRVSSYDEVLTGDTMPGAQWFTGARLNLAGYVLDAGRPDDVAIVGVSEDGTGGLTSPTTLTYADLRARVEALVSTYSRLGVTTGDVVAGYLPNIPEAVVAMLAAAKLGAIWTAVGQDYAGQAVVDRFAQSSPRLLVTANGYRFGGKTHPRAEAVATIRAGLPSLRAVIVVDNLAVGNDTQVTPDGETVPDVQDGVLAWSDATDPGNDKVETVSLPFDHPLWILYSSGTTGIPKGLVHNQGGILVEMLKQLALHMDLGRSDRLLWYTSPSWMMWNLQLMALAVGCAIVTYDGSPTSPSPDVLWRIVAETKVTFFGCSPGFLVASESAGLEPGRDHDLSALTQMGCTGSPLSPQSHAWADRVTGGVPVWSLSGGTDVCTGFIGGAPNVPIWSGELSCLLLATAAEAWDSSGTPVVGDVGELVITKPMPSMPVFLWGDDDGSRYREAYFDVYPGVWRHGDWITITDRGSVVIHGRSDSTLNRHGVRMGSGDIYAAVQKVPQVAEALVIGSEEPGGGYWMPLFVVMADGESLTDEIRTRINAAIREHASPRHVPDEIIEVSGIPHTRTGKKLEIPVKRVLQGAKVSDVVNPDAVDDASLLSRFAELGVDRAAKHAR